MSDDDVEFLDAMVKHHKGALMMARDYLDSTTSATRMARVADLARDIVKAQTSEIAKIEGWLRAAGKAASGGGH